MDQWDVGKLNIDKIIHERVRLLILTYLASSTEKKISFNDLKDRLELTSGNLSVQLKNLQSAGYVEVIKKIKDNKPVTNVSLTTEGFKALNEYITEMEKIIQSVKSPSNDESTE